MNHHTQHPDQTYMEETERNKAITWLLEDPTHRAIHSPTELDAILNKYAAQKEHPNETFTNEQFLPHHTNQPQPPRDTRELTQHNWTM